MKKFLTYFVVLPAFLLTVALIVPPVFNWILVLWGLKIDYTKFLDDRVLESGTNRPIEGAIVVARWRAYTAGSIAGGVSSCLHLDVAITDENGRFDIPEKDDTYMTRTVLDDGIGFIFRHSYDDAEIGAVAYKPGYSEDWPVKGIVPTLYLKPSTSSPEKRIKELRQILTATNCRRDRQDEQQKLLPLFDAMIQELEAVKDQPDWQEALANTTPRSSRNIYETVVALRKFAHAMDENPP